MTTKRPVLEQIDESRTRIHHGKASVGELATERAVSFGGTIVIAGSLAKFITHYWPPPAELHNDALILIVWSVQTAGFALAYLWKKYFG